MTNGVTGRQKMRASPSSATMSNIPVLLAAALALAAAFSLGGCNTVKGAGQDISSAGHGVTQSAEATRDYIFSDKSNRTSSNGYY
jgi:predicted small secreted protein